MKIPAFLASIALLLALPTAAALAEPTPTSPTSGKNLGTSGSSARPTFRWNVAEGEHACQVSVVRQPRTYDDEGVLEYDESAGDRHTRVNPEAVAWRPRLPLPAGRWFWQVASVVPMYDEWGEYDHANCEYDGIALPGPTRSVVVPYLLRRVTAKSVFHYGDQTMRFNVRFWTTADDATVSVVARKGRTIFFSDSTDVSRAWKNNSVWLDWDVSTSIPCNQEYSTFVTVTAGPRSQRLVSRGASFTCS